MKLDDSERLEGVDGHCRSVEGRMLIGDVSDKLNYSIYSTHHYYSRLPWVPFPTSEEFYFYQFRVVCTCKCQKFGKQWFKQISSFIFLT